MKRRLHIPGKLMIAAITLAAVTSCILDSDLRGPASGPVEVQLRLRMPRPTAVATRAVDADFAATSLDLLVFHYEGGEFIYKYNVAADPVSQTGNSEALFAATLMSTDRRVKLLAIANCPPGKLDALGGPGLVTETGIRDAITGDMTDADPDLGEFVMTGDVTLTGGITSSLGSLRIPMMRAVARITIEKAGAVTNFDIRSISLYRSADAARYFPDVEAIVPDESRVNIASVPGSVDYSLIQPVTTTFASGMTGTYSAYLNENEANLVVSEQTCFVVGGYFGGDQSRMTYYRMDFDTEAGAPIFNPPGQVLRNYLYRFTIESVAGVGWNTPEEAANHPASQLEATVTPWNGGADPDERYIVLSENHLMLDPVIGHSDAITIVTSDLPFTILSERHPAAGSLDTADPGTALETDIMSFALERIADPNPGQHAWLLTATSLTEDVIGDELLLEAPDGVMSIRIPVRRNTEFSIDRTSELEMVPATGTRDRNGNNTRFVEYEINVPGTVTWSAEITDYGWASGNNPADHRGWLMDAGGDPATLITGQSPTARLRVGFDKLHYPVVNESPQVTILITVDGHPTMRQSIVVGQQALPSFTGQLKVIDMYSTSYGSLQTESFIRSYSAYLKSARMFGPTGVVTTPGPVSVTATGTSAGAIPASIDPSFRYVHAGGYYTTGYTQQRHNVINDYWQQWGNDRIFVYTVEQRTNSVFANSSNDGNRRTTVLSTLGVNYLVPFSTGYYSKITTSTADKATAVFRYLTQDGPFGAVDDFEYHSYQYDGTSSGVNRQSLPNTAVPILFDRNGTEGGCVMMFIDPANGIVYWGDSQLLDLGQPAFRTADNMADGYRDGHSTLLANFVAYVVGCAQYGSCFADLFVADQWGNYPLYEAAFP